jgi:hypothetical protein
MKSVIAVLVALSAAALLGHGAPGQARHQTVLGGWSPIEGCEEQTWFYLDQ